MSRTHNNWQHTSIDDPQELADFKRRLWLGLSVVQFFAAYGMYITVMPYGPWFGLFANVVLVIFSLDLTYWLTRGTRHPLSDIHFLAPTQPLNL